MFFVFVFNFQQRKIWNGRHSSRDRRICESSMLTIRTAAAVSSFIFPFSALFLSLVLIDNNLDHSVLTELSFLHIFTFLFLSLNVKTKVSKIYVVCCSVSKGTALRLLGFYLLPQTAPNLFFYRIQLRIQRGRFDNFAS